MFVVTTDAVLSYKNFRQAKFANQEHEGSVLLFSEDDYAKLSSNELVEIYNRFNGSKIKRFSDRNTAITRVHNLLASIAKPGGEKRTGQSSGRPSKFAGKKIFRNIANNPRRENTYGWEAWNRIVDGMLFEQYMEATKDIGGRGLKHLIFCIERKFITVTDE